MLPQGITINDQLQLSNFNYKSTEVKKHLEIPSLILGQYLILQWHLNSPYSNVFIGYHRWVVIEVVPDSTQNTCCFTPKLLLSLSGFATYW